MAVTEITSSNPPASMPSDSGQPPVPPQVAAAVTAHLWPQTKKQPVAVAGTVTAFVSATLSLGIGFAWWQLTQLQNASLISLVTAIVAVAAALAARSTVTAGTTPAAETQTGP